MVTLNQILKEISTFATNHKQLKGHWFFGNPPEVNANFDNSLPLLFGFPTDSQLHWNQEEHVFEFSVIDKPGLNKRSEQEILSDTKLIFKDFLAYMKGASFGIDFDVNTDITLTPLVDYLDEGTVGWNGKVTIVSIFDWDLCSVPISGQPSTANPNDVSIIDQNGTVIATIPSGGSYTVTQLTTLLQDLSNTPPTTIIQNLI